MLQNILTASTRVTDSLAVPRGTLLTQSIDWETEVWGKDLLSLLLGADGPLRVMRQRGHYTKAALFQGS